MKIWIALYLLMAGACTQKEEEFVFASSEEFEEEIAANADEDGQVSAVSTHPDSGFVLAEGGQISGRMNPSSDAQIFTGSTLFEGKLQDGERVEHLFSEQVLGPKAVTSAGLYLTETLSFDTSCSDPAIRFSSIGPKLSSFEEPGQYRACIKFCLFQDDQEQFCSVAYTAPLDVLANSAYVDQVFETALQDNNGKLPATSGVTFHSSTFDIEDNSISINASDLADHAQTDILSIESSTFLSQLQNQGAPLNSHDVTYSNILTLSGDTPSCDGVTYPNMTSPDIGDLQNLSTSQSYFICVSLPFDVGTVTTVQVPSEVFTIVPLPLNNPTGFTVTADSDQQFTLRWSSGGGSTADYRISYTQGSTAPENCTSGTVIGPSSVNESTRIYILTNLPAVTQYSFRLCAINSEPTPDVSSGVTATAVTQAVGEPDSITVTSDNTSVDASWSGDSKEFLVIRRASNPVSWSPVNGTTYSTGSQGSDNEIIYVGSGTSVSDTGLDPLSIYYYAIYGFNPVNNRYSSSSTTDGILTTGEFRYLRFNAASVTNNSTQCYIREVEFTWDGSVQANSRVGSVNHIAGSPVTVTSSGDRGSTFEDWRLYDGNKSIYAWGCVTGAFSSSAPYDDASDPDEWVGVDLGAGVTADVEGFDIYFHSSFAGADEFYISGSNDDTTYHTIPQSHVLDTSLGGGSHSYSWNSADGTSKPLAPQTVSYTTPGGYLVSWSTSRGDVAGYVLAQGEADTDVVFTPTTGQSYSAGSQGAETIHYVGTNTSFNVGSLTSSTTQYFKVWAYDAHNNYSDAGSLTVNVP